MYTKPVLIITTLLLLTACGATDTAPYASYQLKAQELAQRLMIVDSHIDVPYRLQEEFQDVTVATENGDFDFPRAARGGLNVVFMSIYIPATYERDGGAKELADELIEMVVDLERRAPNKFGIASNTLDAVNLFDEGRVALALGMENGAALEGSLDNLEYFYRRGIRYITLTHSKANHICDSSYDEERIWNGLSPFGRELVKAMNETGVMIDVSHVSDESFYDVVALTSTPVIASHSSARKFTPGWERNMDDDMIRALSDNGGVIQINFGSAFLTEKAQNWYDKRTAAREAWLEETGHSEEGPEVDQFNKEYREKNDFPFADIEDVLDHIDHVRDIAGIDHVGLGSDYDGVGDSLPKHLKDVSSYPNLIAGLLKRGYTDEEIEKILSGNLMRVWRAVEQYAAAH